MHPMLQEVQFSRRSLLTSTCCGAGLAALSSLLADALAKEVILTDDPLTQRPPHMPPRAQNCIFIYLVGGFSQMDLFDPKPKLTELHGQKLPDSLVKDVQFAFVKKETATIMGSPRKFSRHGQSGLEFSELVPNLAGCADELAVIRSMHTEAFNHTPGELLFNTGTQMAGHPSVGSWVTYGLGSESRELPGFAVFVMGNRDKAYNWSNGFLPSVYQGVRLRNDGAPILNLTNPPGVSIAMQQSQLAALRDLNDVRYRHMHDPEIATRISAYELAFRMQTAAPELIDFSGESQRTLEEYGVTRSEDDARTFATQCLLARRLVERGVRFVNLLHGTWDHHKDLERDLPKQCLVVDQPLGALIRDLKQRGLLESTLVVIGTEFGRTPVSDNGQMPDMPNGRDHHPFAFTVLMAGGGVRGGNVVGSTDELGWNIVENPIHINDMHATMLHLLGLDHLKLTYRFKGRNFRLTDVGGRVVQEILV
ncbi:MAG: DUF1501 domain-containing protein [Pirellulales bacterium]